MAFTKLKCVQCGKDAEVTKSFEMGKQTVHLLKCSHMLMGTALDASDPAKIKSLDNKTLYNYQIEGVRFLEEANGRALIADEMGVGKTVQVLAFIKLHPELAPFFVITKSTLGTQWQKETVRWCGVDYIAQIIGSSKDVFLGGLKAYILSTDILRRFAPKVDSSQPLQERIKTMEENHPLIKAIKRLGIKTIIIDECQAIKNPESQRTIQVRDLCKHVDNVVALSGTPIKNNAAEYFSVLNIIKPEMFPVYARFVYNECDTFWNGKTNKPGGLKNPKAFMEKTKKFIIRRERNDVLPDLPKITRNFSFHELSKEVEAAYVKTLEEFETEFNSGSKGFARETSLLAYISRMRHLTGLSKIDPCIDHVMEFLGSTTRKMVIFVHHKDVAEILHKKLSTICDELELERPLNLTSDLTPEKRSDLVDKFTLSPTRLMIASTLASGEGLNLQVCSDYVMLERQWNPANEEQAEGRFPRPGSTADKIFGTYFVAVGTVDEFFAEIVEQKREIFNQTMGGQAVKWEQSSLMKELFEVLAQKGVKRWKL